MANYSPRPVGQNKQGQYIDQYGRVIPTNYTPAPVGQTRSGSYVYGEDAGVPPVVARARAAERARAEQQSQSVEVKTQLQPIQKAITPVVASTIPSRSLNTVSALGVANAIQGQQEVTRQGMEAARKQFEEQRRVQNVGATPAPGQPPLTKMDMQIREITNLNVGTPSNFETVRGESISVDVNGNRVVNFRSATETLPQANVDHPNGQIPQLGKNALVGTPKRDYVTTIPSAESFVPLRNAQVIQQAKEEGRLKVNTTTTEKQVPTGNYLVEYSPANLTPDQKLTNQARARVGQPEAFPSTVTRLVPETQTQSETQIQYNIVPDLSKLRNDPFYTSESTTPTSIGARTGQVPPIVANPNGVQVSYSLKNILSGETAGQLQQLSVENLKAGDKSKYFYNIGGATILSAFNPIPPLKGLFETEAEVGRLYSQGKIVEGIAYPSQAIIKSGKEVFGYASQGTPELASTITVLGGSVLLAKGGEIAAGKFNEKIIKPKIVPIVSEKLAEIFPAKVIEPRSIVVNTGTKVTGNINPEVIGVVGTGKTVGVPGFSDFEITKVESGFIFGSIGKVKGFGVPKGTVVSAEGIALSTENIINGKSGGVSVFAEGTSNSAFVQKGKVISFDQDFTSITDLRTNAQTGGRTVYGNTRGISGKGVYSARFLGYTAEPNFPTTRINSLDVYTGRVKTGLGLSDVEPRTPFGKEGSILDQLATRIRERGGAKVKGTGINVGGRDILDLRKQKVIIYDPTAEKPLSFSGKAFGVQKSVTSFQQGKVVNLLQNEFSSQFKSGDSAFFGERSVTTEPQLLARPTLRYSNPEISVEVIPTEPKPTILGEGTPKKGMSPLSADQIEQLKKMAKQDADYVKALREREQEAKPITSPSEGGRTQTQTVTKAKEQASQIVSTKTKIDFIDAEAGVDYAIGAELGVRANIAQVAGISDLIGKNIPKPVLFPSIPRVAPFPPERRIKPYEPGNIFIPRNASGSRTSAGTISTFKDKLGFLNQPRNDFMPKTENAFKFKYNNKVGSDSIVDKAFKYLGGTDNANLPKTPSEPVFNLPPTSFPPFPLKFPFIAPSGGGNPPGGSPSQFYSPSGVKGKKGKIKKQSFLPTEPFTSFALFRGERIISPSQKVLKQYYQAGVARPTVQGIKEGFTLASKPSVGKEKRSVNKLKQFSSGFKKGGYREFSSVVFGGKKKKK